MSLTPQQLRDVADTVYAEARGESFAGQVAVAHVIRNRELAGPVEECASDIVRADMQFSCWNAIPDGGSMDINRNSDSYRQIESMVRAVWAGELPDPSGGADHYLNRAVTAGYYNGNIPSRHWSNVYDDTLRIGNHTFYRGDEVEARANLNFYNDTNQVNTILARHPAGSGGVVQLASGSSAAGEAEEETTGARIRNTATNLWERIQGFFGDLMENPGQTLQQNWMPILLGIVGIFAAFKVLGGIFNFFGGTAESVGQDVANQVEGNIRENVSGAVSEVVDQFIPGATPAQPSTGQAAGRG